MFTQANPATSIHEVSIAKMWLPLTGPRFWCTIKTLVTVSRASGPFRPTTALIASQVFSHRPTVAAEHLAS